MKVYTRKGDTGETSLLSGGRVRKEDLRVEAYGTVDELSSLIGLLRSEELPEEVGRKLVMIQEVLFAVGAALADPEGRMEHDSGVWDAEVLESWIDAMDAELESLTTFILPGGCRAAALSHVARTVCRRAERRVCEMGEVSDGLLAYLNRLSDSFFTLARFINARAGVSETAWRP